MALCFLDFFVFAFHQVAEVLHSVPFIILLATGERKEVFKKTTNTVAVSYVQAHHQKVHRESLM